MEHTWTVQLDPSHRPPWLARLTPALVMGGYKYNFIKFKRPLKSQTKMDIYPDAPVNDGDVYAMGTSNPRTEVKSKCYGIYTKTNGWKWFPTLADLKGGTMLGEVLPRFVLPTSYSYSPDADEVPVVHETRADGTAFRVLQVGETTRLGDLMTSKSNPSGLGICPIGSHLGNIKVTAEADFRFLRPVSPPPLNPTPTPPAKKGNPIADLADYWLFKYKDACEDDEERAVWERVLETLK